MTTSRELGTKELREQLAVALDELALAESELATATSAEDETRRCKSAAVNRANAAQKEVDRLCSAIRAGASRDTDWGRRRVTGTEAP